jgi:hypothetical protein
MLSFYALMLLAFVALAYGFYRLARGTRKIAQSIERNKSDKAQ